MIWLSPDEMVRWLVISAVIAVVVVVGLFILAMLGAGSGSSGAASGPGRVQDSGSSSSGFCPRCGGTGWLPGQQGPCRHGPL